MSTVCLRIIAITARLQHRSTRSGLRGTGGGGGWVTPGRVGSVEAGWLAGSAPRRDHRPRPAGTIRREGCEERRENYIGIGIGMRS